VRNRGVPNQEQVLTWDSENRLSAVTYTNRTATGSGGGSLPTTCNGAPCKRVYFPLVMQQTPAERYSYDADGGRIRKETQTEVIRTIGPHFEVTVAITNSQVLTTTKYYDFGGQRIAVRQVVGANQTLSYLHGDHLASTSVTTSNTGAKTNDVRYYAYGGQRSGNVLNLPTDYAFTGQKLDRNTGLLYYGARYYDGALGMFISPDPLVPDPGNPQALNRYAYAANNPLGRVDPTGHAPQSVAPIIDFSRLQLDISNWPQLARALAVVPSAVIGLVVDNERQVIRGRTPEEQVSDVIGLANPLSIVGPAAGIGEKLVAEGGEAAAKAAASEAPRVFWSGGRLAREAAETWARAHGATTLEMTPEGRLLETAILHTVTSCAFSKV
jgi:RHS repeat-associated protein